MSTTYTLFTEVQVADKWYCISPLMRIVDHIIDPTESELALVPTFETNARYHFENTYELIHDDGYSITLNDLSDDLQNESAKAHTDFAEPTLAIDYERITGYLNLQLKEHHAFALRSDVAAFENGQEEDIYDYVCLEVYKKMDEELKKAYQYYEWNDSHGAFRYYTEFKRRVDEQLANWQYVNYRKEPAAVRLVLFIS